MVRKIDRLRTLLFSVAVGGALMFGARTALAAPTEASCPDFSIGRCRTQAGCQLHCDAQYPGSGLLGVCEEGCCYCVEG